jgi:holo-[acyl-carrier protein] synthase
MSQMRAGKVDDLGRRRRANLARAMIIGVGVDLVGNGRLERELARGEWSFADGVFTAREIRSCSRSRRPAARYAACFAAKEATLKALGISACDLGMMREVELHLDGSGKSAIVLRGRLKSESERLGVRHLRISMSSSKQQTAAMVIVES